MLDHSPHAPSETSIIALVFLEIWQELLAIVGISILAVVVIAIVVAMTKAYRRGLRHRGEE